MEAAIFAGLQVGGKSTFYARHLLHTHIRVSLDTVKTRHRERRLFETCLELAQPVAVDNTNPQPEDRARYLAPAKARGFSVIGYYFASKLEDCLARNAQREGKRRVPEKGLRGTHARLVLPSYEEGFDVLHYVHIDASGRFVVEGWRDEVH